METLLLVEDDTFQAQLCMEELEEEGYRVIHAGNGDEALRKLVENEVHLIILDIRMPVMDGVETLHRIFARKISAPVIIHTAYANLKDEFITWVADAYVVKSSDFSALKSKIRDCLHPDEQRISGE